jgi:hypothetical protein
MLFESSNLSPSAKQTGVLWPMSRTAPPLTTHGWYDARSRPVYEDINIIHSPSLHILLYVADMEKVEASSLGFCKVDGTPRGRGGDDSTEDFGCPLSPPPAR